MIKVSIIIPYLNTERYLEKCLNSLVSQTLTEIEIICIDNGSTDNSATIVKEYEKRDRRIKNHDCFHGHQGAARNIGLQYAKGDYIGFVDSDDFVDPYMFEKMFARSTAVNADMAVCNYNCYYEENDIYHPGLDATWFEQNNIFKIEENKKFFRNLTICNKIIKRAFLVHHQISFPENIYHEDQPFVILSYILANKIVTVNEPLYFYRKNMTVSSSTQYIEHWEDVFKALQLTMSIVKTIKSAYTDIIDDIAEIKISRYLSFLHKLPSKYIGAYFNIMKFEFQQINLKKHLEIATKTEFREFIFIKKHGLLRWQIFILLRKFYGLLIRLDIIKKRTQHVDEENLLSAQ